MKEGKLYINGSWIRSSSRRTFDNLNPATGKLFGKYQAGNAKDVKKAVQSASTSLKSWKKTPAPMRAQILFETSRLLRKNKDRLTKIIVLEMGKVWKEAAGDVQEAIDMF